AKKGGFYSALDADSEGIEGKFYTFHQEEVENILNEDASLFIDYYHVTKVGNWSEEGTNVLYCAMDGDNVALESGFLLDEWENYLREIKEKLRVYREKRIRPRLDNKQLTSWNALFLKGLVDAYRVFDKQLSLDRAIQRANVIKQYCFRDTNLLHSPAHHN